MARGDRRGFGISVRRMGPLYHGTHMAGLETVDSTAAEHRHSTGMPHGHAARGANFVTTSYEDALGYAEHSAALMQRNLGQQFQPHVYEVEPTSHRLEHWSPDEHSGPSGWYDGPGSRREAHDVASEGGAVSLRFTVPLRVVRKHTEHPDYSDG
jgi:hypothetical protein